MCRIGSWCARSSRRLDRVSIYYWSVCFSLTLASRQNGGGTVAAYPFPIGFISATTTILLRWALLALAHKSKWFTTRKSQKDLIYTNVPDGLYISSELCLLQDPRVSLPLIYISAYPTPYISKPLARAIRSSRSIPYGYLVFSLFRKQQQRNCRRRQVRRNIMYILKLQFR